MRTYQIKSFLAMVVPCLMIAFTMLILAKNINFMEVGIMMLFYGGFSMVGWAVFILPILKWINKIFLENPAKKWFLPVFSAIYGAVVFLILIIIFAAFQGDLSNFSFDSSMTGLTSTAAVFGVVWSVVYLILNRRNHSVSA